MAQTMIWLRWLIGVGAVLVVPSPAMAGPMAATVAAGGRHTCVLTSGGGVACWGDNSFGQLGDGTTTRRLSPVAVTGLSSGVTSIAAGWLYTCAVTGGGGVVCWGDNSSGQLGDGTSTTRTMPVAVSGLASGVTLVVAGYLHTCALTSGGRVMCWGANSFGQVGDGHNNNGCFLCGYRTPVTVSGLGGGVRAVTAGGYHTCALTSDGYVVCWGDNGTSQLGNDTTVPSGSPVFVQNLAFGGVRSVVAGFVHTCALSTGGAVGCWGNNLVGQLGVGRISASSAPTVVSGLSNGVAEVSAGNSHACAVTGGGGVVCWGANSSGQLGDGTTTQRLMPVAVSGLSGGVSTVAAGTSHSCAVTSGGAVACWGDNAFGQLGDGTTTRRLTPVTVFDGEVPTMSVDRPLLVFAAVSDGTRFSSQTSSQTVRLTPLVAEPVTWTAASTMPWLVVAPTSGSGPATLTISTQFASGLTTSQTGQITLTFSGSALTTRRIPVTLTTVSSSAPTSPPFGSFDTPGGDTTVLSGSVAVTGWTLDNIGVQRVELWRDLQAGEGTPPFISTPSDPRNGKVFISNATLVDGARPDVEALYPTTPLNYGGGWGYLMLTWGLFGQGNGTYTFYAFGVDMEGNTATIGTKTVIISNNAATKPFGSIDTPAIGGEASGPNFGWALTPKVNGVATCKIQPSGVQYSIDSGPLQPVAYGDTRTDIAGTFAGFSNTAAAGGHAIIDWTALGSGSHTIGWLITDDCNRADGVGSRFFTVNMGANGVTAADGVDATAQRVAVASEPAALRESDAPITVAKGYGELPLVVDPGVAGSRTIEVKQGERIEVRLPHGFDSAYQLGPAGQMRSLPIGATWDPASSTFYWQPAPAFLGRYRIVFSDGNQKISVRVIVVP